MIAIAGTGAVGGTTGAYLRRAGRDVLLVDGWHQNVEAIRRDGLVLKGRDEEFRVESRALHLDELARLDAPLDAVLLAVKSYDTEWMMRAFLPYLAPDGCVVSLQNGVNEERIAELAGPERTVGCVVHLSVGMFEPGVATRYTRSDWLTFTLGELDGRRTERVARLAELLEPAGPVEVSEDIWGALWMKLAINAMNNGLTGLTGLTSPGLWLDPRGFAAMVRIGGEVVAVSEAVGHRMHPIEPTGAPRPIEPAVLRRAAEGDAAALDDVRAVFAATGEARRKGGRENLSSLLQDVMKRRRTEIEYLNGYVARRGAGLGVAAPANALVVDLVHRLERGELARDPANLDEFTATAEGPRLR
ncbi:MAG TPA: 2-dehydropantoate 2-reductase [Candidatus Dormibacteraeota bacterium]|nr:2-dehydropantoate 2-reductase [Candidatus Dormibacteraeota bacterium]